MEVKAREADRRGQAGCRDGWAAALKIPWATKVARLRRVGELAPASALLARLAGTLAHGPTDRVSPRALPPAPVNGWQKD